MFAKFNKIGVASAVAAALGASGAAQAVILGQPGGALLVPHVIANAAAQVNTLIGVVVGDNLPPVNVQPNQNPPAPWYTYGTDNEGAPGCVNRSAAASAGNRANLHWYFFDTESVKKRDGTVGVTCNDFVRIDWNYLTTGTSLQGVAGYMVIGDTFANAGTNPSKLALWGASYLIQGNWASQAFIPVLPLYDVADSDPFDEVSYSGGFPSNVNPVSAGMALPGVGSGSELAQFSLRYFNDPALSGNTRFVVWLPNNDADRDAVGVLVYDADEASVSSTISLTKELTVIDSLTDPNLAGITTNDPANASNGFSPPNHVIPDLASPSAGPAIDSGFVLFSLQDGAGASVGEFGTSARRGGVAFSLVGIGAGSSGVQVQTEMAHERGVSGGVPAAPVVPEEPVVTP